MPTLSALRPQPNRKVDAGLAAVGLLVFSAGFGSWFAIVVTAALAFVWWGRPIGMAALFALAISAAAHVSACRVARASADAPTRAASALVRDRAATPTG